MWIKNTDKEVECFHPVCKEALESALKQLNLGEVYEVQHHRYVGKIEMDLVIANRQTNKILCVVEVKRTITAVNSTRYQYQAMSYVQSLRDVELESKYYILTNLESSCLFKYDVNRPNVYEQIIQPGITINHRFADVSRKDFMAGLTEQYANYISTIKSDSGKYLLSFKKFAEEIQGKLDNQYEWKRALVGLLYEYIRGSFTKVDRKGMKSIAQLSHKLDLICREGAKINFKDIFSLPRLSPSERDVNTSKPLLRELFELGKTYVDADELANVMHKVISNDYTHDGEVPTDTELATLLLSLVKCFHGELKPNEIIFDPAAGSGNLICAAVTVFDSIQPKQLMANDINSQLLQLLSLRLGLKFAKTIEKNNTAQISAKNIADFVPSDFRNVKVIVMNPPYLAATGFNCTRRKAELYLNIKNLKGVKPTTNVGQMPLEGPFAELVSTLAQEGTVMAAILPSSHLTTKGEASQALRKMLLEDFGLQLIFNYPQERLFDSVAQNTSIVIGVKGTQAETVHYLYCNEAIQDVDISGIADILSGASSPTWLIDKDGEFEGALLLRSDLTDAIEVGWQIGNQTKCNAQSFIAENIKPSHYLTRLIDSEFKEFKRGKVGNDGITDLLYLTPEDELYTDAYHLLEGHFKIGLNNADYSNFQIGSGDSLFVDVSNMPEQDIQSLSNMFVKDYKKYGKKQKQLKKTPKQCVSILKKESKHIAPAFCVLLPRAIRAQGRVYVNEHPTFVSTNFFTIESDEIKSRILASWFSTIFFQLECEANVNNRKGLRKLEKADYKPMHVPVIDNLSEEQKRLILSTSITKFLDLRMPRIREIDRVWAEILFGKNAKQMIDEALTLLPILVADREK